MSADRVKGPASCCPSIETAYGQPIEHSLGIVRAMPDLQYMDRVALPKPELGLGHDHANTIVAHVRAENGRVEKQG